MRASGVQKSLTMAAHGPNSAAELNTEKPGDRGKVDRHDCDCTVPLRRAGRSGSWAETVAGSVMFGESFRKRRCLVPASGFYEWKTVAKKNAIASITGIWIAAKMTTRITPDQNSPDCSVDV